MPYLGHGVGLRSQHYREFLDDSPACAWLELISENFMLPGGRPLAVLERVRCERPMVLHGVSMSIGGSDPLNLPYLKKLRTMAQDFSPAWISDHLCWGSYQGHYAHDLLPIPYTEQALKQVVDRVGRVQDILQQQILLENVSSYVEFKSSIMPEWEFISRVADDADCGILLDVNNIFVSAHNHGYRPQDYIDAIPPGRIGQIHLAGHTNQGNYLLDSHVGPTPDAVLDLYRYTIKRSGPISTLTEWDEEVPPLATLLAEANKSARIMREVVPAASAPCSH